MAMVTAARMRAQLRQQQAAIEEARAGVSEASREVARAEHALSLAQSRLGAALQSAQRMRDAHFRAQVRVQRLRVELARA